MTTPELLTAAAAKLGKQPWEVWPGWYSFFSEQYTGPDLTDERNLWALMRVCDAVSDPNWLAGLTYAPGDHGGRWTCVIDRGDSAFGHGPTRSAAACAAIEEACK